VTADLEMLPNAWARGGSSSNDSARLLALYTDDCTFGDVTFGVATRGKEELRSFVNGAFAAVPDFKYESRSWFCRGSMGHYRVGHVRHTHGLHFSLNENPHGAILAFASRLKTTHQQTCLY
jgi:hypothetical protein